MLAHLLSQSGDLGPHLDVVVAHDLVVLVDRRLEHLPDQLPLDAHPQQIPLLQELVHALANLQHLHFLPRWFTVKFICSWQKFACGQIIHQVGERDLLPSVAVPLI